jgi:hypothetical protein
LFWFHKLRDTPPQKNVARTGYMYTPAFRPSLFAGSTIWTGRQVGRVVITSHI